MLIYIDIDTLYFDYYNNSASELHQINGDKVALVLILLNKKNIAMTLHFSVVERFSLYEYVATKKRTFYGCKCTHVLVIKIELLFTNLRQQSRHSLVYIESHFFPLFHSFFSIQCI